MTRVARFRSTAAWKPEGARGSLRARMSAERDEADSECSHQLRGHEVSNVKKISFLNETQYIYGPSPEYDSRVASACSEARAGIMDMGKQAFLRG